MYAKFMSVNQTLKSNNSSEYEHFSCLYIEHVTLWKELSTSIQYVEIACFAI